MVFGDANRGCPRAMPTGKSAPVFQIAPGAQRARWAPGCDEKAWSARYGGDEPASL